MFVSYTIILLLFMSSTHSFRFNIFRELTREITSYMGRSETNANETLWLEQNLDHFDKNEKRKWQMRFFRRNDFWKENGPIYVFLGGEGKASPGFLYSGLTYELAKETNGALYATEHRYYGKSMPINVPNPDLKYLSARQALADNANFIRTLKKSENFQNSKVVVIGGSYSGNLATWMRLLYPDLVDAAIASSAPVLAKKDFYEFLEKVSDDFKLYGSEKCWSSINNFFKHYEKMFSTKEGIEKLKKDEYICPSNDMSIPENKQLFFAVKAFSLANIVQNGDTTAIKNLCGPSSTLKQLPLVEYVGLWSDQHGCFNYDFNYIVNDAFKHKIDDLVSWTYQICTEFGYFQSTSSDRQPFTNNIPVDYFVKICTIAYGPEFNESRVDRGVNSTNKMFGGLKPKVTNVVFVNGGLDPWSPLGILESLSDNAPAIVIPRASHCRDLFPNKDGDEKVLIDARKNIKNYIKKWIGFQK